MDLVIAPEMGNVTSAVASSPTAPLTGVHSVTSTENVYDGLADEAAAVPFGFTTQVTAVEPTSGKKIPSTVLYELWIENVTELSMRPDTLVIADDPKAVVGTSAALELMVTAAT